MRADVLSLLPPQLDENGNPTGRRLVNDIDLAAAGLGAHGDAARARHRQPDAAERGRQPARRVSRRPSRRAAARVVVYDGVHVQARTRSRRRRSAVSCSRTRNGAAKVTQIISRGAANSTDQYGLAGAGGTTTVTNLFAGGSSPDSDRTWVSSTTTVTARCRLATAARSASSSP
jgi:hypothetical protein